MRIVFFKYKTQECIDARVSVVCSSACHAPPWWWFEEDLDVRVNVGWASDKLTPRLYVPSFIVIVN